MGSPLASLCVKFYNQRELVQRALRSAFAQTYRPLQIVISDDCSQDGTDAEIRKALADFCLKYPDIMVKYEHNTLNLGMIRNTEKVFRMADGALMVQMDGDDISHIDRVEKIVSAWTKDGCRANVIMHSAMQVDDTGHTLGEIERRHPPYDVCGATMAYTKSVITGYADVVEVDAFDDHVFAVRGALKGPCLWMDDVLLDYYVGAGASTSIHRWRTSTARSFCRVVAAHRQSLLDIEMMRERDEYTTKGLDRGGGIKCEVDKAIKSLEGKLMLLSGKSFATRLKGWRSLEMHWSWHPRMTLWCFVWILCLLPPAFECLPNALMRFKFFMKRFK